MNFESQRDYDFYVRAYGRPHSAHKIILTDPDGQGTSELPADGLEYYLANGFCWPKPPPTPLPESDEPEPHSMKLPFECSCGRKYRYESTLKGHRTKTDHA